MAPTTVTILCATLGARDAVRLTLHSLRRYTREPYRLLVADNGSTDGTLEWLRTQRWLGLATREERAGRSEASSPDDDQPLRHGTTLDWLVQRVETEFFLTLDSDVEFLRPGWLREMTELARREALVALGDYEPEIGRYRARLAPHVLLVDTAAFRRLGGSFRSFVHILDPVEAARWRRRRPSFLLTAERMEEFRSARFYPTGAAFFERLLETGARWGVPARTTSAKYRHLGHLSWAAAEGGPVAVEHRAKLAYIRRRLASYETRTTNP